MTINTNRYHKNKLIVNLFNDNIMVSIDGELILLTGENHGDLTREQRAVYLDSNGGFAEKF